MLSQDILKQIKRIELAAGHSVTEALAGNYVSVFKGRGMEFDTVREYTPGDDVRTIDWNVTARMNHPFVKVHREERELTVMLVVDVSPSQRFGTGGKQKREVAAELAAVLAFMATRTGDKVGLVCFSDHVEAFIPPKKGRGHVWNIIRTVLTHEGAGGNTDIALALEHVRRVLKRRSMCFLISDFWAWGFEDALRLTARRHDIICARTFDQREMELPNAGVVAVQDAETGDLLTVDSGLRRAREGYEASVKARFADLTSVFRRAKVGSFQVGTAESVVTPLVSFLRERERRSRRSG